MIEEIKKEYEYLLQFTIPTECDSEEQCNEYYKMLGRRECLKEILDKYDNQPDYKSAWNELKNQPTNYITKYLDKFGFVEEKTLNKLIEELEQKYNLGGE